MVAGIALLAIGFLGGGAAGTVLEPVLRGAKQKLNQLVPNELPDPSSLIITDRRKQLREGEFKETMTRWGYDDFSRFVLQQALRPFPNVQDGIRFAVREAFREDISTLFELDTNFEKLFEDRPKEFFEKVGIGKDELELFWRSHWELPSVNQGFEMFQRLSDLQLPFKQQTIKDLELTDDKVRVNNFELDTLLTTLDVMPAWQRRLKMISYQPITRVDIRRFVKRGIVPIDEAEFRYREIGNSPEDAALQVQFIQIEQKLDEIEPLLKKGEMAPDEAINQLTEINRNRVRSQEIVTNIMRTAKKTRTAKEKDLTRAQLDEAFEDGLITKDDYLASIQNQGFDEAEANIIFQILENDIAKKELKETEKVKKVTKSEAIRGFINDINTQSETEDLLDELGFDEDSIELMILNAQVKKDKAAKRAADKDKRAAQRATKEQSKSDTLKALKKGVISEAKAIEELKEARFSDEAISIILGTVSASEQ